MPRLSPHEGSLVTRSGPILVGVLLLLLQVARAVLGSSLAFADIQNTLCCASHCSDSGVKATGCDCCVVAPLPAEAAIPEHGTDHASAAYLSSPVQSAELTTVERTASAPLPVAVVISEPPLFLRLCNLRR